MGLPSTPIVIDVDATELSVSTVVIVGVLLQVGLVHAATFKLPTVLAWLMMGLPSGPIVIDECCPAEPESTVVIVAVSVQVGLVHAATFKAL